MSVHRPPSVGRSDPAFQCLILGQKGTPRSSKIQGKRGKKKKSWVIFAKGKKKKKMCARTSVLDEPAPREKGARTRLSERE